ncbi:double-strand-break repair protein rad21 homolog isoform X2 [Condylostylus longicornis]|uniref:double-strand-break repair protein rad21 homolog isoform X2 n=1 Tax=Condylostylus longicornis TaxID=2530218 RepID=UPI00244E32D2|nr:double-strand-break repair protein rad21 homolog isoform X2 [Condylostylus longicornis]
MFYAHIVLAKKGPLARIWLAAHWDKKLTKAHVFETNIEQSVEGIMQPKVKLALRTSGHLLLGVVRIYSRKAKYLLADCNEAFVKIKMAFRPGIVDLPEGHREAAVNAITLPEVFHDFDTALPELNDVDIEAQFSINQSRADEITMREDYGSLSMSIHDDGFGDMGFDADTADLVRDGMDPNIDENLFAEELEKDVNQTKEPIAGTSKDILNDDNLVDPHLDADGFGDEFQAVGLFEGDIFGEPAPAEPQLSANLPKNDDSDDDLGHFDGGAPSPLQSLGGSRPNSPEKDLEKTLTTGNLQQLVEESEKEQIEGGAGGSEEVLEKNEDNNETAVADQTTLIHNEEESFALAPVDASAYRGVTKAKRKRKLIVDEVKNISGEEMKSQLANTSDIVTTLDLAPPTKRLMFWKETGGVEKLFALPSRDISARSLFTLYQRHLLSHACGVEDFSMLGPADVLAIDQLQHDSESPNTIIPNKRTNRKRKLVEELQKQHQIESEPHHQEELRQEAEQEQLKQTLDITGVSQVSEIDQARDIEAQSRVSAISLDINNVPVDTSIPPQPQTTEGESLLMPPPATPGLDAVRSPSHYPSLPDLGSLGPMTPGLPAIPMTPGNLSHGIGLHDEFPHPSALTPADLPDGAITPHHPGIENIESIPNLPADQVSSILSAAEGGNISNENLDLSGGDRYVGDNNEWNNDYDFPQSVAQHQPGDEQQENETDEQFEERVLNKRAAQMFFAVKRKFEKKESLMLSEMTFRNNRKQAAQKFYSLLVLKKFCALEIFQDEPYGDIAVKKGPMFDNPKL